MSMIAYIGFNFPIKLNEGDVEHEYEVDYVCPDAEHLNIVKQKHFTTPYIFEILQFANPITSAGTEKKMKTLKLN